MATRAVIILVVLAMGSFSDAFFAYNTQPSLASIRTAARADTDTASELKSLQIESSPLTPAVSPAFAEDAKDEGGRAQTTAEMSKRISSKKADLV
jgi:hypothetical protein